MSSCSFVTQSIIIPGDGSAGSSFRVVDLTVDAERRKSALDDNCWGPARYWHYYVRTTVKCATKGGGRNERYIYEMSYWSRARRIFIETLLKDEQEFRVVARTVYP